MSIEKTLSEQISFGIEKAINEILDPHRAGLRAHIVTLNDMLNRIPGWRSDIYSASTNAPFHLSVKKGNDIKSFVMVCQRLKTTVTMQTQIKYRGRDGEPTAFDDENVNEIAIIIKPKNGGADPNENTKVCFFDKEFIKECVESNILKTQRTADGIMINVPDNWAKLNCQYMVKYTDFGYNRKFNGIKDINPDKTIFLQ